MNLNPESEISQEHQIEVVWDAGFEAVEGLPARSLFVDWALQALRHLGCQPSEVCIKIVSGEEMSHLNNHYRHQSGPTNVLSFPSQTNSEEGRRLIGDIALCADVVRAEAEQQDKSVNAHFAHMVVHGVLHLSGYEHQENQQATQMEQIETAILRTMGFPDPYRAL